MNPFVNAEIYQTVGIAEASKQAENFKTQVVISLGRFYAKNWGEVSEEDFNRNEKALKYKDRILAAYETVKGKIWITAESDNKIDYSRITVLFPSEY